MAVSELEHLPGINQHAGRGLKLIGYKNNGLEFKSLISFFDIH